MKKLIPYLLLNIVISALSMLVVLLIWNATHKTSIVLMPTQGTGNLPTQSASEPLQAMPTDAGVIEIVAVVGVGDLNFEYVQISNRGDLPTGLQGWKIVDEQDNQYTFPPITLFPGGSLSLYSKTGMDSAAELYWGRSDPVWSTGEKVKLQDALGNTRAEFQIP